MADTHRAASLAGLVLGIGAVLLQTVAVRAVRPEPMSAAAAIQLAAVERLGADVEVTVVSIDVPARAGSTFLRARPDPAARLGGPMRFTLVPVAGPSVIAVVTLKVVGEHVVARRDLGRGETVADEDVNVVRGELPAAPMRRLPSGAQVVGSRVLRPVPAGAVVLPGAVAVRRAIEPGDTVTVVAIVGDIAVSARLTAADGGETGDVIRVVNGETRRSLRGRIVSEGLVEVNYAR